MKSEEKDLRKTRRKAKRSRMKVPKVDTSAILELLEASSTTMQQDSRTHSTLGDEDTDYLDGEEASGEDEGEDEEEEQEEEEKREQEEEEKEEQEEEREYGGEEESAEMDSVNTMVYSKTASK